MIEFTCEAIWSWTFVESFINTNSISVHVIVLFIFSIFSWFSLVDCTYLGICPFVLVCPFYWHLLLFVVIMILYIWDGHCNISFFTVFYIDLGPLFSWWVWLKVYLFYFSKNQLLVPLIFSSAVFVSFISILILIISFFLLTLGFACSSFSSCFRCKVRLYFWNFSCLMR